MMGWYLAWGDWNSNNSWGGDVHIDLCKKRKTVGSSILEVGNKESKEGGDGVGKGLWKPKASEEERKRTPRRAMWT